MCSHEVSDTSLGLFLMIHTCMFLWELECLYKYPDIITVVHSIKFKNSKPDKRIHFTTNSHTGVINHRWMGSKC